MPVASKALSVPVAGQQAWERISSALAADLVVIRTQTALGRGKKRKPVDVELHVNPLGIGTVFVGAGLAMWLLQLRAAPTATAVEYGKWVWPSDGTAASKEIELAKRGTAPTRPYDGVSYNPDSIPPYTTGFERASWTVTRVEIESRMAITSRQGFLNGGQGTDTSGSVPWYVSPLGWALGY